jgi:hypothetical protein
MSQPRPTSYNEIIAHTITEALSLSINSKGKNEIAGFCQLQGPTGGGKSSSLYRSPDGTIPSSNADLYSCSFFIDGLVVILLPYGAYWLSDSL